jgi:hypothetical protein
LLAARTVENVAMPAMHGWVKNNQFLTIFPPLPNTRLTLASHNPPRNLNEPPFPIGRDDGYDPMPIMITKTILSSALAIIGACA